MLQVWKAQAPHGYADGDGDGEVETALRYQQISRSSRGYNTRGHKAYLNWLFVFITVWLLLCYCLAQVRTREEFAEVWSREQLKINFSKKELRLQVFTVAYSRYQKNVTIIRWKNNCFAFKSVWF